MTKTDVGTLLNSIGKRTFIKYYEAFKDMDISHPEMIDRLALDPQKFSSITMPNKTSSARRIFREGLEIEALQIIVESRTDVESVKKARILLDKELKNKGIDIIDSKKISYKTKAKNQPISKEVNFKILDALAKLRELPIDEEISEKIELLESFL